MKRTKRMMKLQALLFTLMLLGVLAIGATQAQGLFEVSLSPNGGSESSIPVTISGTSKIDSRSGRDIHVFWATTEPVSERTEVQLIDLTPNGFEPVEIMRPEGKFLLGVNNRTGLSDLTIQLINDSGVTTAQKRMIKDRVWRKVVDPKPGRYLLAVVGHPDWRCQITITTR
jgi:hypothetical protein